MRVRTQLVGDVVEPVRQRQSRSPEDGDRDCGIAAEVLSQVRAETPRRFVVGISGAVGHAG
jgi:hypothetical protein